MEGKIVRGKVQWKSDDDELGLILDQQGRQIYYTRDAIIPMVSGEKPVPAEGDAVDVLVGEQQIAEGIQKAEKVVTLGKLD